MRILQLCNRVPWPPQDGGAIAMINMSRAFNALGHELHMLCLNTNRHFVKEEDMPPLFRDIASFRAVYIETDVEPVGALKNILFSRQSYHISRFRSKAFSRKLIYVLKQAKFDVIHLEGLHISLYLPIIRRYSQAPVVLRAHNIEFLIWQRLAQAEGNKFKKWYINKMAARLQKYELSVFDKFDAIVPITAHDMQTIRSFGCQSITHVSPTGIDIEDYKVDTQQVEWPAVFHIGSMDWLPNQQAIQWFLQEVWPLVLEKERGAKFYIAGRHMPQWLKMLNKPGVEIVGEVADAKLFMNSKAIMVVPLLSGSGMRIKIIEGMAMAKAIVATTIGAEGIEVTHGKNILLADTAADFAEAILKCINNRQFNNSLGANARLLAEQKYTNLQLVKELINFYEELKV